MNSLNAESEAWVVSRAAQQANTAGCTATQLAATRSLADAEDALEHRDFPNSMTYLNPDDIPKHPERIAVGKLRQGLLSHPTYFPFACDILVRQVEHATEPTIGSVGRSIELALRMDGSSRNVCTHRVMAAIPVNSLMNDYISHYPSAQCRRERLGHCERLHRP